LTPSQGAHRLSRSPGQATTQGKPRTTATTDKEIKAREKERKEQTKVNIMSAYTMRRRNTILALQVTQRDKIEILAGTDIVDVDFCGVPLESV
jgi:hypothetical protein